ncbi:MAG: flagellar export protein FliJ [Alteromonadaceae bacterium]|nr:flagellar export protein FliJ [Alteromonadaceae bacterium]
MKQLDIIVKFEQDKEQQAALKLQAAEFDYQQNIERLNNVGEYRLEYMKRLSQRAMEGIDSATYTHFHAFVSKLDNAAEQVQIAITQSKSLVDQYKSLWLKQRQKVQAVELLREKKCKKLAIIAEKQEQKMFDEIATQRFVRRNLNLNF